MNISTALSEFTVAFHIPFPPGFTLTLFGETLTGIDVTETIIISWVAMAILIGAAFILTRRLKTVPTGPQVLVESAVGFLNTMSSQYFGKRARIYGPYVGTIFLFLLVVNIIPFISPVAVPLLGVEPPFSIKPPARDINFTAALSVLTLLLILGGGFAARGVGGWFRNLCQPVPMMLPFNLLDYIVRPLSLCLRLFGNILGGFIIMQLVEMALPVPFLVPMALSAYFDFFDGFIQALVFTFLTMLYVSEAVEVS